MRVRKAADSPEFVANIRDIAEQKHAEEQLADANAELSAMSIADPLTGISNRRHFDQMLRREWKRAMRTASPLAMPMVDIDLFKSFNDMHGHLAGDRCLRDVARTIAAVAARRIAHPGNPLRVVTVSIGVASAIPLFGALPNALVEAADAALYRAKNGGRNRAEIALPLALRPLAAEMSDSE